MADRCIRPARVGPEPPPLSIFNSYSPELIAQWCGVSLKTASLYKAGVRKPSRQALRLFSLHRDGRVLTPDWRGWCVRDGKLIDPEGNETNQGQLRGYYMVLHWVAAVASRDPETQQQYYDLLRRP
jgi:hypothetical protein